MEELEQSKQFYAKEKANRRKLSAEIQKGNDIIKKFQAENLELVEKVGSGYNCFSQNSSH